MSKITIKKKRVEELAEQVENTLNEMELLSWEYLDGAEIDWSEDDDESDDEYRAIVDNYQVVVTLVPKN